MSLLDTIKNLINKLDGNKSAPVEEKEIPTPEVKPQPVVETKVEELKPEPEVAVKPQAAPKPVVKVAPSSSLNIPEDSTLRRHFLSALEVDVIAALPPRPTDSSLKRHYDAMVQAEIEKKLG